MKLIFAGTPEFAVPALRLLYEHGHQICAVYTQPDRPKGRGQKMQPSPVKEFALQHQIPVEQPLNFKDTESQETLKNYQADMMIVIAYGLILPKVILETPKMGCINVHASLLPKYRGASPIQGALLAGEMITGVTIMQMDEGLDSGDILTSQLCEIEASDTSSSLHQKLSNIGAMLLLLTINKIEEDEIEPVEQNHKKATYTKKIKKADALVDWTKDCWEIERQTRAYFPWPISHTLLNGKPLRIWAASVNQTYALKGQQKPQAGEIVETHDEGIIVACGQGFLELKNLQLAGGKSLPVKAFLNARKEDFSCGTKLGI